MGKKKQKSGKRRSGSTGHPNNEYRSHFVTDFILVADNNRTIDLINLKTQVVNNAGGGQIPSYKYFNWYCRAMNTTQPIRVELFAIFVETGGAFTDGNIPWTTALTAGFDTLIDKDFSYQKVGEVPVNVVAPYEFETEKMQKISLLPYIKKIERLAEDSMFESICPEVFIVGLVKGKIAGSTLLDVYQEYGMNHIPRQKPIGF